MEDSDENLLWTSEHDLYRWFNDKGDLLYIGISVNAFTRASRHRLSAVWWQEATLMTRERHPNRSAALLAEREAIRSEHPRYNIDQVPVPREPKTSRGKLRESILLGRERLESLRGVLPLEQLLDFHLAIDKAYKNGSRPNQEIERLVTQAEDLARRTKDIA